VQDTLAGIRREKKGHYSYDKLIELTLEPKSMSTILAANEWFMDQCKDVQYLSEDKRKFLDRDAFTVVLERLIRSKRRSPSVPVWRELFYAVYRESGKQHAPSKNDHPVISPTQDRNVDSDVDRIDDEAQQRLEPSVVAKPRSSGKRRSKKRKLGAETRLSRNEEETIQLAGESQKPEHVQNERALEPTQDYDIENAQTEIPQEYEEKKPAHHEKKRLTAHSRNSLSAIRNQETIAKVQEARAEADKELETEYLNSLEHSKEFRLQEAKKHFKKLHEVDKRIHDDFERQHEAQITEYKQRLQEILAKNKEELHQHLKQIQVHREKIITERMEKVQERLRKEKELMRLTEEIEDKQQDIRFARNTLSRLHDSTKRERVAKQIKRQEIDYARLEAQSLRILGMQAK